MSAAESAVGYVFKNKELLKRALTHSSYSNEDRTHGSESYERLEFLGDSVLSLIASDYLFRSYEGINEGESSKIRAGAVCEASLHEAALGFGLSACLLLGRGEENNGGRDRASILADVVEAILAAIYLDGGMEAATAFIKGFLYRKIDVGCRHCGDRDYKTRLQEIVQRNKQEVLSYHPVKVEGPDHDRTYVVEVRINSNVFATGRGKSKKDAEQHAARLALELMGEEA